MIKEIKRIMINNFKGYALKKIERVLVLLGSSL